MATKLTKQEIDRLEFNLSIANQAQESNLEKEEITKAHKFLEGVKALFNEEKINFKDTKALQEELEKKGIKVPQEWLERFNTPNKIKGEINVN